MLFKLYFGRVGLPGIHRDVEIARFVAVLVEVNLHFERIVGLDDLVLAEPKSTRISFRPKFSMSLTKVPCRSKNIPVFCERIRAVVLSESPVIIVVPF